MGHRLPAKAKLENHGKLLIVPRVEQEDGGNYMCKAKNALGEAVHYYTVTVEGNSCTLGTLTEAVRLNFNYFIVKKQIIHPFLKGRCRESLDKFNKKGARLGLGV